MESEVPIDSGLLSDGQLGESNEFARFISAIDGVIGNTSDALDSAEVAQEAIIHEDEIRKQAIQEVNARLEQVFANQIFERFNDPVKIETIQEFIVNDMGITDKTKILETLNAWLVQSSHMPDERVGPLDKLFNLVMHKKARHGAGGR